MFPDLLLRCGLCRQGHNPEKIRTEAISIWLNSLPSYLGSLWRLRLNKTLGSNLKWLRQVPRFASYCLRPGRVPWKFLLWLSKLFFSPQLICCSCDQTENPTRTLLVPKRAACVAGRFIHQVWIYIEVTRKLPTFTVMRWKAIIDLYYAHRLFSQTIT